MAYEKDQVVTKTFKAGADLSAKQYYFMKLTGTADEVTVCNGATDKPIGVLQNKPTSGQAAEVVIIGITKVSADGTLDEGDSIGTSADGQAAVYTASDTTKFIVGQALLPAAAGEIGTAVIDCANIRALA